MTASLHVAGSGKADKHLQSSFGLYPRPGLINSHLEFCPFPGRERRMQAWTHSEAEEDWTCGEVIEALANPKSSFCSWGDPLAFSWVRVRLTAFTHQCRLVTGPRLPRKLVWAQARQPSSGRRVEGVDSRAMCQQHSLKPRALAPQGWRDPVAQPRIHHTPPYLQTATQRPCMLQGPAPGPAALQPYPSPLPTAGTADVSLLGTLKGPDTVVTCECQFLFLGCPWLLHTSNCCSTESPQAWWLKTEHICSLTVLEVWSPTYISLIPNQGIGRAGLLQKAGGKGLPACLSDL